MVHILKFDPIYKERIWGARHLEALFGRSLPLDMTIGESWDLADLPQGTSHVAVGPSAGKELNQLVEKWNSDLLGSAAADAGRFPLLVKFLDANDVLSVQVHPNHEQASRMGPPVRAKYEAWYVVSAKPDAVIYRGFKSGVTREHVEQALANDTLPDLLIKHPAQEGDWFYLPGGTVHALGAGLVVAEVQTPSDTTFRLYDWGRIDSKTGQPRPLHVEQALACLDFESGDDQTPKGTASETFDGVLLAAPTFQLGKRFKATGATGFVDVTDPLVWIVLTGSGRIGNEAFALDFRSGDVLLMPAGLGRADYAVDTNCSYLEVNLK